MAPDVRPRFNAHNNKPTARVLCRPVHFRVFRKANSLRNVVFDGFFFSLSDRTKPVPVGKFDGQYDYFVSHVCKYSHISLHGLRIRVLRGDRGDATADELTNTKTTDSDFRTGKRIILLYRVIVSSTNLPVICMRSKRIGHSRQPVTSSHRCIHLFKHAEIAGFETIDGEKKKKKYIDPLSKSPYDTDAPKAFVLQLWKNGLWRTGVRLSFDPHVKLELYFFSINRHDNFYYYCT